MCGKGEGENPIVGYKAICKSCGYPVEGERND
jgi:hypothetical protein